MESGEVFRVELREAPEEQDKSEGELAVGSEAVGGEVVPMLSEESNLINGRRLSLTRVAEYQRNQRANGQEWARALFIPPTV